jgi:hypothetical protein
LLEIKLKIKEDPSVSIIDLEDNSVTNVPLAARSVPTSIDLMKQDKEYSLPMV